MLLCTSQGESRAPCTAHVSLQGVALLEMPRPKPKPVPCLPLGHQGGQWRFPDQAGRVTASKNLTCVHTELGECLAASQSPELPMTVWQEVGMRRVEYCDSSGLPRRATPRRAGTGGWQEAMSRAGRDETCPNPACWKGVFALSSHCANQGQTHRLTCFFPLTVQTYPTFVSTRRANGYTEPVDQLF